MDSYRRALYHHPNNAYALVLMSCVPDPVLMPTAKADSCFRRGLFLLRSQHRWAALLAYGEFVAARTGDLLRAQQLLREAVKLSFSKSVWPAIAYAHFLQVRLLSLGSASPDPNPPPRRSAINSTCGDE